MSTITTVAMLVLATSASAGEMQVHRSLFYTDAKTERQSLDIYQPGKGQEHAIVVWIHGGGWRQGNKASVQRKPQAFVEKGFVVEIHPGTGCLQTGRSHGAWGQGKLD